MADTKGDDRKDVPYQAEWAENLRHRPDPNRIGSLQIPMPGSFPSAESGTITPYRDPDVPTTTGTQHSRPAMTSAAIAHDPQSIPAEPSYYDVPMLKQPVWKWQIAAYFYLGGISAGAYVLGRVARRGGDERHQRLARVASYTALAALLPCPGLLIWDLGDPKRFHHMLRVWKPESPMNLGTWAITAYGGMAAFEAARQYLIWKGEKGDSPSVRKLRGLMNNGALLLLHDAAGVPFALVVASYTGVLLSCTSNPLWCKNPWLSPLFTASAMSTGAEAVSLLMDATPGRETGQATLQWVDTVAHAVEIMAMRGFMKHAGEKADSLRRGKMKKYHHFSIGAIVAAEVVKRIQVPRGFEKSQRMLAAGLGLAGGFALRWAMVMGGHEAAGDPHTSRLVSKGKAPQPGSR